VLIVKTKLTNLRISLVFDNLAHEPTYKLFYCQYVNATLQEQRSIWMCARQFCETKSNPTLCTI